MLQSGLTIDLKLAYAPICNFDFVSLKEEAIIQEILQGSMLYAIAQRSLLTFENVTFNEDEGSLEFEIRIQGKYHVLNCVLPLHQELIEPDDTKPINLLFGSYSRNWEQEPSLPVNGVNGIKLYKQNGDFVLWISPDKFIHHHQNGILECTINGDIRPFNTFIVHYVGKATDQEIWKRLTGHGTLQEILSLEYPFNYGTLPTHEIILLLFRVHDLLSVKTMGDDIDEFVDSLFGNTLPSEKEVSLDAEKLLIKLLDPNYNDKKFPNYPKSSDGLYKFNFNRFVYHIAEDITLKYQDRELYFSIDQAQSDLIGIKDNKEVEVVNFRINNNQDELPIN